MNNDKVEDECISSRTKRLCKDVTEALSTQILFTKPNIKTIHDAIALVQKIIDPGWLVSYRPVLTYDDGDIGVSRDYLCIILTNLSNPSETFEITVKSVPRAEAYCKRIQY